MGDLDVVQRVLHHVVAGHAIENRFSGKNQTVLDDPGGDSFHIIGYHIFSVSQTRFDSNSLPLATI